ncbi:MAG: (4Fe-4S)-binding protein [Lentisphaerae bacterium]|jgi:epoxyqueuosine reductase|nr:(4Fe-4S)-binding protein [Lentisphaerota bacterium]MBT4817854.1 (4Fe-4S)-binding protein [Lentisphaerota bacterium]MBT5604621.1 (4Fe-4S)-binding protein [Lentisphaerota bacterium]MBT7057423.1 (4Fe-4S)-binding protein [Lentisphaerota bacterium]MBT7845496.1 (4Fe-4S)-binding protein [Lentisphaerota bacterium]
MSRELTEQVKAVARQSGADIVGIGSMDRYEGAPKQYDARYIYPEAKTIIGFGFRIPRGYLRGVEEGTHFYQYPAMGYANINEVYAPAVIREVVCHVEDLGYEGVPIRNFGGTGTHSDFDGSLGHDPAFPRSLKYTKPLREGYPAPDVYVHFRIAAFICGMGEIGYSNVFLTPEFGPRQRFAFMLTDAPLEPDPIYDGPELCDRCMKCVSECPGALTAKESVTTTVAGHDIEMSKLDPWYCAFAYASGLSEINPFLPPDALDEIPDGRKILNGEKKPTKEETQKIWGILGRYFPKPNGYNPAMCGGRGCLRACMIHLEEQGKLKNRFHEPFRKRPPWWKNPVQ